MIKGKKQETKQKQEDKVRSELENTKAMLVRALADYDNLSKRVERERQAFEKIASVGVLTKLFSVLDNLESAQNHVKDAGLAICIGEFKKVLNDEGLTEINPTIGDEFNENTMEAIEVIAGERDNTISEVMLKGWSFEDGQVIRHAKVKVTKIEN